MLQLSLPLVLASGSPRRKEILTTMGLDYTIDVSEVDERCSGTPDQMVLTLSERKARAVASRNANALVLAADTLVYGGENVLGKPDSAENAFEMLRTLSGKWHEVYTGMTLLNTATGKCLRSAVCTRVHFVELSDEEILTYIATGEPLDKAGAYGIQGVAGMFIDAIDGSYSNVVGLPMAQLRQMIKEIENAEN